MILANSPVMSHVFAGRIWGELGKISFMMYLVHIGVIMTIFNISDVAGISIDFSHEVMLFCFIIIVFIVASIIHYLIEKPVTFYLFKQLNKI